MTLRNSKLLLTLAALTASSSLFADTIDVHVMPPLDFHKIASNYMQKHGDQNAAPVLAVYDDRGDMATANRVGTLSNLTNSIIEQVGFQPGHLSTMFDIQNKFPSTFKATYSVSAGAANNTIYSCAAPFTVTNPKGFTQAQDYIMELYPDHCVIHPK